jgi:hypothetical protein
VSDALAMGEGVKSMKLPRAVTIPIRVLAATAIGFYGTVTCFDLLASAVEVADGWNDAVKPVEAAAMMFGLGVTCAVMTSALLVLRPALGRAALVGAAAAVGALTAMLFSGDTWPLSEWLLFDWQWRIAALWNIALGTGLGAALAGRRSGARFLWIPLCELAAGFVTIWVVLEPVRRAVS